MKGLTRAQWINLNRNNRCVLANQCSVMCEKIGPILPPLVGLTAGKLADEIWVDFEILKLLYRLIYSEFYFVLYHCYFTAVLELHSVGFSQVKIYFKVCFEVRKFGSHFFSCLSLLLGTNVPNDNNNLPPSLVKLSPGDRKQGINKCWPYHKSFIVIGLLPKNSN